MPAVDPQVDRRAEITCGPDGTVVPLGWLLDRSLHSSGLIALLDGVIPLKAAAELQFLAPARGRLVARCNLTESDVATVRALLDGETDKICLTIAGDVANAAGAVVCTGGFRWNVRRATS